MINGLCAVFFPTIRTNQGVVVFFSHFAAHQMQDLQKYRKRIGTGMIENLYNYPKTLRISMYCEDMRDGEVACIGHRHINLVPL